MKKALKRRDIRDWDAYKRARWAWNRFGYEDHFPRGCGFTDVDALCEFDGHRLMIETKHWEGFGPVPTIPTGQRLALGREAQDSGKTVLCLFGNAQENNPLFVHNLGTGDRYDLRPHIVEARRQVLHSIIDASMGLPFGNWCE